MCVCICMQQSAYAVHIFKIQHIHLLEQIYRRKCSVLKLVNVCLYFQIKYIYTHIYVYI